MNPYKLNKIPLNKENVYSSGDKLPLGKLDPRLGSVRLNSASGSGIRLYDKNYGSRFPDGTVGLEGYAHRRLVGIVPAVGADPTGMQMIGFKVYYGSGQDSDGVAYLGGWCRWDFNDVRFGDAAGNEYKIRRRNKIDGVSCEIDVLVPLNLNTAQNVYLYFGNETASAADDDATFEAVIPNVVGAWPMDEANAEDPVLDYSGNDNHGTATGTTIVDDPQYAGKKARQFGNGEYITIPNSESMKNFSALTTLVLAKVGAFTGEGRYLLNGGYWDSPYGDVIYASATVNRLNAFLKNTDAGVKNSILDFTPDDIVQIGYVWDGENFRGVGNGVLGSPLPLAGTVDPTAPLIIGKYMPSQFFNGIICYVLRFKSALTSAQVAAIYANYPDPTLEAGKVLVRKWASTTQPSWGTPQPTETRQAYATKELYPSQHDLGFTIDRANKKMSKEYYVGNTERETASALIYFEDDITGWHVYQDGTGTKGLAITEESTIARRGTKSMRIESSNMGFSYCGFQRIFATPVNLTGLDFILLDWYGINSGTTFSVVLATTDTDRWLWNVTENFVGWKRIVLPIKIPTTTQGTPLITSIAKIQVSGTSLGDGVRYLDQFALDFGVWAYIESSVPDMLQQQARNSKVAISLWDVASSTYQTVCPWNTDNWTWRTDVSKTLSGATLKNIYGEIENYHSFQSATMFNLGKRGEVVTRRDTTMGNISVTLEGKDTKYMVGYAVKMPPDDGLASATTGGGQVKIKEEVSYV